MKVKYTNVPKNDNNDDWLTVNKDYSVLCIEYTSNRKIFLFRILADNGRTPALFESDLFTLVSSVIPKNWVIDFSEGIFQLSPKAWLEDDFWENFFDQDKQAQAIFEAECNIIYSCD